MDTDNNCQPAITWAPRQDMNSPEAQPLQLSKLTRISGGLLKVEIPHSLGDSQTYLEVRHSFACTCAISQDKRDKGTSHSGSCLFFLGGVIISLQPPLGAEGERLREVFRIVHQAVNPHTNKSSCWDDVTVHNERLSQWREDPSHATSHQVLGAKYASPRR